LSKEYGKILSLREIPIAQQFIGTRIWKILILNVSTGT